MSRQPNISLLHALTPASGGQAPRCDQVVKTTFKIDRGLTPPPPPLLSLFPFSPPFLLLSQVLLLVFICVYKNVGGRGLRGIQRI